MVDGAQVFQEAVHCLASGGEGYVLMACTSGTAINRLATMGLMDDPIATQSVCL